MSTYYNTATPQEQEPKFGQIIHKTKSQDKVYSQNLVKLLEPKFGQHSYSKAPVEQEPKFGQIIHKTKSKLQHSYTQDKVLFTRQSLLQHSYSKAAVEQWNCLEPKFVQIIHKTKSTYYNTATPRLQWNKSQNLVKLNTNQSLHTTTQLLQGSSGTRAKIWSN